LQPSEFAKIATLILVARILSKSQFHTVVDSLNAVRVGVSRYHSPHHLYLSATGSGLGYGNPDHGFFRIIQCRISQAVFHNIACGCDDADRSGGLRPPPLRSVSSRLNNMTALENRSEYEKHSILPLKDYQRNRLLTFLSIQTLIDPKGSGRQLERAAIAHLDRHGRTQRKRLD
jgi:rod shape determining protein RodA